VPGLTFVSFGYKRNGFASFAIKRRKKLPLQTDVNNFIT